MLVISASHLQTPKMTKCYLRKLQPIVISNGRGGHGGRHVLHKNLVSVPLEGRVAMAEHVIMHSKISPNRGEIQALVGAIPFCCEYPGPRFEDKFRSANQMDRISIADGGKMAGS